MPTLHQRTTAASLCLTVLIAFGLTAYLHAGGNNATIRLGSWNIEHLGSPAFRAKPNQDKAQHPKDLAAYIRHARVDILSLQEITADAEAPPGTAAGLKTSKTLTETLQILNMNPGNEWKHLLFPKQPPEATSALKFEQQWVGVMWNAAKVSPVGEVFRVPVSNKSADGGRLWDRNVYAIKFSAGKGKTDFVVIPVHMKSNRGGAQPKRRAEEAKELVKKLPELAKPFPAEGDFVVIGDTNALEGEVALVKELESAGLKDLNQNTDTYVSSGLQPFDRIFVPASQKEFTAATMEVVNDFLQLHKLTPGQFRTRYSDHFIVVTTIQVLADDDE